MDTSLNIFLVLIFICLLISLLFSFFKLRKRYYNLTLKEIELQKFNHEILKKQKKLEEQKSTIDKEWDVIKIERESLEREIQRINEEKNIVQDEWRKIKLEREWLEKQKTELNERDKQIQIREQQLIEDRKFIDDEKDRSLKEKERQLDIERQALDRETEKIKKEQHDIKNEKEKLDRLKTELEEKDKKLKAEIERIRQLQQTGQKEDNKKEGTPPIQRPPHRPTSGNRPITHVDKKEPRILPEFICWKRGRCWNLGIQISEHLSAISNFEIIQDGEALSQDENNENCWVLKSISSVQIKWQEEDGIKSKRFSLLEDETSFPLVFKLIGKGETFGKLVKNPTHGAFCAIVPDNWQRDEKLSDSAQFEPEEFFIAGYKVHFFYLRRHSGFSIAFIKPDGKRVTRSPKDLRFSFSGNQIQDANDEIGPLFGNELPKVIDNQEWREIETIIVGEEGEGIGKLRWEIQPDPNSHELDLNKLDQQGIIGISKSNKSWFFIRFYDVNDKLVESLDFRFIQGLKKIIISEHPFIPESNGHLPVTIKFLHDKSCTVTINKNENSKVIITHYEEETIATIPPEAAWDLTDWKIEDGGGRKVNIELLIERIWWNLGNEKDPFTQTDWSDKPLNIPKDYFSPTSQYAIFLQFPKPGWIKKITLGFDKRKSRQYKVLSTQRSIKIPLREFCDCEEISKSIEQAKLLLWIEKGGLQNEVVIAIIGSKPVPPPEPEAEPIPIDLNNKPCCFNCDHARRKFNVSWCRRSNWPQQASIENFKERIAHFKCGEWRGEYQDKNGNWVFK